MPLPDRMKERRRLLHLTQEQLAALVGVSLPTIAGYERGIIWPSKPRLDKLAEVLKTTPGKLID